MKLIILEDMSEVGREVSSWVDARQPRRLFVPAGQTPIALYQLWERERPHFLRHCELLQIDDVLTGPARFQFKAFFERELPTYISQFQWIDRGDQTADAALLGLGLNGHIAFHEPGLGPTFYSGCVRLSSTTCRQLRVAEGTWGITYGGGAFEMCASLAIMVTGESKREVLKKLLAGDETLPATALLKHSDLTIFADRAAHP